jgi:D-glycero-D-manno-heptose 1,7-bisphosphate phosphatase
MANNEKIEILPVQNNPDSINRAKEIVIHSKNQKFVLLNYDLNDLCFDLIAFCSLAQNEIVHNQIICPLHYQTNHENKLLYIPSKDFIIKNYRNYSSEYFDGFKILSTLFFRREQSEDVFQLMSLLMNQKNDGQFKPKNSLNNLLQKNIKLKGVPLPFLKTTYLDLTTKRDNMKSPVLFLDRDGIINIDKNYLSKKEDVELFTGVYDLIKTAKNNGFLIFCVTNQSGIARGMFNENELKEINDYIDSLLKEESASLDGWIFSPFHYEKGLNQYKKKSLLRKPGGGMLLEACKDRIIDFTNCYMIGDKCSDQIELPWIKTFLLQRDYDLSKSKVPIFHNYQDLIQSIF